MKALCRIDKKITIGASDMGFWYSGVYGPAFDFGLGVFEFFTNIGKLT